jgi:apolipoprotein N-acyltransferase
LRGDIEQATAYGVDAAIRQRIPMNQTLTFYVRFGDWLAWLALGATLSLGLVGFINLSKWQILVLKK